MGRKLIRFIILIICIAIGIGVIRSVYTLWQKKGIIAERQHVLRELTEKNRQLQEDLQEATSPAFIEQAARDKLGLVREGETVVIMDKSQITNHNLPRRQAGDQPSWKQWWSLFF